MIDHTGIGVADVARSAAFYDATLGALGLHRVMQLPENDGVDGVGYGVDFPVFWIDRFHPDGVKQDHVWVCTGKQIDNLAIAAEARVGHAEHVGESQDVLWKLRRHPEREDGSRGDPGRAGERRFGATPLA